jgi:hypothetical protein
MTLVVAKKLHTLRHRSVLSKLNEAIYKEFPALWQHVCGDFTPDNVLEMKNLSQRRNAQKRRRDSVISPSESSSSDSSSDDDVEEVDQVPKAGKDKAKPMPAALLDEDLAVVKHYKNASAKTNTNANANSSAKAKTNTNANKEKEVIPLWQLLEERERTSTDVKARCQEKQQLGVQQKENQQKALALAQQNSKLMDKHERLIKEDARLASLVGKNGGVVSDEPPAKKQRLNLLVAKPEEL